MKKGRSIIVFCICLVLVSGLLSCGKEASIYQKDVERMKNGNYYIEVTNKEHDDALSFVFAKQNDRYFLEIKLDGISDFVLFTPEQSYVLDADEKTYSDFDAYDLNYNYVKKVLDFKIKKISEDEDGTVTVHCKHNLHKLNSRDAELVYKDSRLCGVNLSLFVPDDYAQYEVKNFSEDIPSDIFFEIPADYDYQTPNYKYYE